MADWFKCSSCPYLHMLTDDMSRTICIECGKPGRVIPQDQIDEGMKSGVYYNIDPKTGGRAKKKRRR